MLLYPENLLDMTYYYTKSFPKLSSFSTMIIQTVNIMHMKIQQHSLAKPYAVDMHSKHLKMTIYYHQRQ